jgi:multiple antibiotic resistance protein
MNLLFLVLILFLIMNPMGNVINYLTLMREIPPEKRGLTCLRETGIALFVMIFFYAIGDVLFDWLKFSEIGLRIASGLILFLIALRILFPPATKPPVEFLPGEPYVFPFAIPMIAGPALLATIMLYSHLEPSKPMMLLAILIAWSATSTLLFLSPFLERILGASGLAACEKLMAMVLVLLSVQRLTTGIQLFITGKCCD